MNHQRLLDDYRRELKPRGWQKRSIQLRLHYCRRFLKFIGPTQDPAKVSAETVKAFLELPRRSAATVMNYKHAVASFLKFVGERLPAPKGWHAAAALPVPAKNPQELALNRQWSLEKLIEQKETDADVIAKLARKVIDHYLYFQGRLKGETENLDDVCRFADECKELIEQHLPLFMKLSAQGRNIHSKIDERVQP